MHGSNAVRLEGVCKTFVMVHRRDRHQENQEISTPLAKSNCFAIQLRVFFPHQELFSTSLNVSEV